MKCMALAVLCCLAIGRDAAAVDKPPDAPKAQRIWLRCNLLSDIMETNKRIPGMFGKGDTARAQAIGNASAAARLKISDEDLALLAGYYYRTRTQAAADLRQVPGQVANPQQAGAANGNLAAIAAVAAQLATKGGAVKSLSELIYASLPGFCLREQQTLPGTYFALDPRNDQLNYVGPANSADYSGSYGAHMDNYLHSEAARHDQWLRGVFLWHSQNWMWRPGAGNGNGCGPRCPGRTGTASEARPGSPGGRTTVNPNQGRGGTAVGTSR